jgi:hypothetical protein
MNEQILGYNRHRLIEDDPYYETEVKLSKLFNEQQDGFWNTVVFGTDIWNKPKSYLTDDQMKVVASVIQWLGTPVGKSFLERAGFTYSSDTQK